MRHGESTWNLENRFCGWFDAGLSPKGVSYQFILFKKLHSVRSQGSSLRSIIVIESQT